MKIKTQVFATMVVFGVTLAVIGTSVVASVRQISHLDGEDEIAVNVGRGASELSFLYGDYLLYREEQQRRRWELKWASVSRDLSRLSPATPEELSIVDDIEDDLARVKTVFEDVAQTPEGTSRQGGESGPDASFQVAWSRLAVQSQAAAFDALRLTRLLREERARVSSGNVQLIIVMLALFAIYFVTNYMIVFRRTLRSIEQLRAGTKIVGSGDLDHAIPVTRNDEIGELTRAFNRMTADLKGVTASRTELENEVAEREMAEAALRGSLQRIDALSAARQRELETTKLLLEAAVALAEWTDLGHVLEALADIVLASTGHTRVTVQLWDNVNRELQVVVVRGEQARFPVRGTTAWDEISGPAREVIETMRPKVIDYDALPEDRRGRAARIGARLGLAVPLVYRQRLVGLVLVDDPGGRREFVDREIALIQGIAAQAAVAIENGRLYEEERRIADALRSVFQRPVPVIDGVDLGVVGQYASKAERVGGDFYDAFALGDQVAVLVGDVAGKGLAAVGLTERVRSAVRALAYAGETLSPTYLLRKVNESLVRQLPAGEFITAVLLTIDTKTGAYRFARAGHPFPIICGDTCRQIQIASGPPLGVAEGEYAESSGVMAPGETLLLYTDGVTEARRDSEFYGEDRLLEFLSERRLHPQEVAEALFAHVQEFSRGKLADDLLIVALRLHESAPVPYS